MSITLPLKDMTVEEKRRLMETLWDDHSRNANGFNRRLFWASALSARMARGGVLKMSW